MKGFSCHGEPSLTMYGRGCRCDLCRSAKSLYEGERRRRKNKFRDRTPRKPAGKRDSPFVMDDAFTREQILEARA